MILVPDPDIQKTTEHGGTIDRPWMFRFRSDGSVQWKQPLRAMVRVKAISRSGDRVVANTFDEQIVAWNKDGHVEWSQPGHCEPVIFEADKQILCLHDDDSDPKTAYRVFDWSGKPVTSVPASAEALHFVVDAEDSKRGVTVASAGGGVTHFEKNTVAWTSKISGEVVRMVGDNELTWILELRKISSRARKQVLSVLDGKGRRCGERELDSYSEQLERGAVPMSVVVYGNNPKGQSLSEFRVTFKSDGNCDIQPGFKHSDPYFADFSPKLISVGGRVLAGFTPSSVVTRVEGLPDSHLWSLDQAGKIQSEILVPTQDGSYLTTAAKIDGAIWVWVGSDLSKLSLYKISSD